MLGLLRKLLGRHSHPLNQVTIDKNILQGNFHFLNSYRPGIFIAPVLKSNAYGHGITEVGRILDSVNDHQPKIPFFCVDSLFEAYQLNKTNIKTPILIMGYIDPKSLSAKKLNFEYAIFDLEMAKALNKYQKGARVHIFVDTGMNREGVKIEDLADFIKELKQLKEIKVVGLMSHLACSNEPDSQITKSQISNFKLAKKICFEEKLNIEWFHFGGSLALFNKNIKECNLIRCGIALYGIDTRKNLIPDPPLSGDKYNLAPTLSLSTKIVQIKEVKKGQSIGYSSTYKAKKDMVIAILPIGYNDGVDRRLSNKGVVLVAGPECPIIGLISMNITTIDISTVKNPVLGQDVVIFSRLREDKNSIENCAKICQTNSHDLLVGINPNTRREVC